MGTEVIIDVEKQEKRVAILENGELDQYFIERPQQRRLVGNIYKAKVETIVSGIQAAFLNLGLKKNGFLYVSDITKPFADYREIIEEEAEELEPTRFKQHVNIHDVLSSGQEVLVQVVKGDIGTKGPRLTTNISLPGRYLVLMPYQKCIGISKRIESAQERDRLRQIISSFKLPEGAGLIVRTFGEGVSKRELVRDYKYLYGLFKKINHKASRSKAPALIHEEYDLILRVIRDYFSEDVEKLIVDDKDEYHRIGRFLHSLTPGLKSRLVLHKDKKSLFEKLKLEQMVDKIYKRKVELKSGGYIIIEPTESLVAIDVNTGSFVKKDSLEETAYITNKEAAVEIARQIKLRDLGGIVVIDFIDMNSRKHQHEVYRTLMKTLKNDRAKTKVLPISELGVVEMTRQRVGKSLESMSYQTCPNCKGKGLIKSIPTVAIDALRSIKKILQLNKCRELNVHLNPKVASYIFNNQRKELVELESDHRIRINLLADEGLSVGDINIAKT